MTSSHFVMASSSFMHQMNSSSLPQASDTLKPSFLGLVTLQSSLQYHSHSDLVYATNTALPATKLCTISCRASSGTYRVLKGGKNAARGGRNWAQDDASGENSSESIRDDKQDSRGDFDSTEQRQRRGSVYRGSRGSSRGGYEKLRTSTIDDNAEGQKASRGNYNGVEFRDPGRSYRGSRGVGSSSGGYRSSRTSSFNGSNRDDYRLSGREFDSRSETQTYGENRKTSFRDSGRSNRGSTGYRSSRYSSYKENDRRYGGQEVGERSSSGYRDSERNYRGSRGAYGNARDGGYSRYDAMRRQADKKMHKGAYEMVDDETGEKVVVWGVEDDDNLPKPSGSDLKWKPTTMAVAGDVSEEAWYKAMEAQIAGPSGAFSVKGVRQGGVYDDEEEDEDEDEDEEGEFDDDSDYESLGDEELLETSSTTFQTHASKVVRSVKVRLFGRDFRGKDFVTSEKSHESAFDKENQVTGNNSRDERGTEVQDRNFVVGVGSTNNDKSVLPVKETSDRAWPPADPLKVGAFQEDVRQSHEDSTRRGADGSCAGPSSRDYTSSNSPVEEVTDQPWPPTGPLSLGTSGGLFSLRESLEDPREASSMSEVLTRDSDEVYTELHSSGGTLVEGGYGSGEGSTIPEPNPFGELKPSNFSESQSKTGSRCDSTSWPPGGGMVEGSTRFTDLSYLREDGNNQFHEEEGTASKQDESRPSVGRRQNVWRNVERVVREEDWKAGMNPGIIDIDEDNGDEDQEAEVTSATKLTSQRSAKEVKARKNTELVKREEDWQGGMNPGVVEIIEADEVGLLRKEQKVRDSGPVRANLLDSLRIQTHRKLGSKLESDKHTVPEIDTVGRRSESVTGEVWGVTEKDKSEVIVVKPRGYKDLQARNNFDPTLAAEFYSQKSFKDVGASEDIIGALMSLQVARPSAIQAMAFKPVLEGQSCIIADQTGSGKTLAYVAPLVQSLRDEEAKGAAKALSKNPRVLVLVPTSELAVQVLDVCRAFSKGGAPFRSIVLTGGFKWKTQVESLAQGADVVIATPGRFFKHLQTGSLQLDNLKCAVLDEVDILYDDQEFAEVLEMVEQSASKRLQFVHVTATLPVDIHDSLLARYPDSLPLMGPNLHRTAVGLQEILVDCSGAEGEEKTLEAAFLSKKSALLQLVDQRPVSKTIIFCNKIETCRRVENVLGRHDRSETKLTVLPYHAALSQEARLESMQQFLESQPKKNLFLVCTDRASRGLDSFDVEHVVLFDYPRDPSEYVRRVGRTARGAGGTGKVFVFALGKQVAMARRTMARNEKGHPIHDVPGSKYEF